MQHPSFVSALALQYKKLNILNVYYFVVFFYALPFLFLFLFLVDQFFFHKTDMLFWVIFLLSLIPSAVFGGVLSIIGIIKSGKIKSKINKFVGICLLCMGGGGIVAGILAVMLLYIVVS